MRVYAGHQSPWDLLGLIPGCTEREVRSAYARALKVTRPDDDAAAFQQLVEARDFVLMMARDGIAFRLVEDEDEDEPEDGEDQAPAGSGDLGLEADEPELGPPEPPPIAPSPAIDDRLVATPGSEPDRVTLQVTLPEPPEILAPAKVAKRADADADPVLASGRDVDPSLLCAEITRRLVADASPDIVADWKRWIARVGWLDHETRNQLEPALLALLPALLPPIARLTGPVAPGPWVFRMLGLGRNRAEAPMRALAVEQAEILVALDEDFGWTRFDRHVYATLGADNARLVLSKLSGLVQAAEIRRNGLPRRRNEQGIPQLDERDLRAFFGDAYSAYAAPYAAARLRNRWAPVWDTRRALLMPVQALGHRLWLPLAAWLSSLTFAFYLSFLPDLQPIWLSHYANAHTEITTVIALTPLVLVHLWYGVYGYVQRLSRATRTVIEADRRGLFQPEQRFAYIGRQGATRAKVAVKGRIPGYAWYVGIFVLIRALAAFNHSPLQTPYIPPKPGIDLIQKYLDDAKRHGAVNIQAVEAIKRLRAGGNGDLQPRLNPLESNEPKLGDFSPGLKSPNEPNP